MRLGYHTGYWSAGPPPGAQEAVVGAPSSSGSTRSGRPRPTAPTRCTPLAWWGARTTRIRLGTAIAQISARTPTATAMAALTLDHLSGGRFVLGLGASGPQVVEGWYGQPYPKPLARTREYVDIVRQVLRPRGARHARRPVLPAPAARRRGRRAGQGAALDRAPAARRTCPSTSPPRARATSRSRPRSPTAGCRCSTRRAWTASSGRSSPRDSPSAPPGSRPSRTSRSSPPSRSSCGADVESAADSVRPFIALYAGGMGAKGANFHRDVAGPARVRRGVRRDPGALPRRRPRARRPPPSRSSWSQDVALVGPADDIRAQLPAWRGTAVTTLLVQADPRTLPAIAGRPARTGLTAVWTTTTRRPCSTWSPPSPPGAR